MFIKQLLVGPMDVFCYLVGCRQTGIAIVIDPGAEADRIASEAKKEEFSISFIVNTHRHSDHTAGNSRLKVLTGAQVVMHSLDAEQHGNVDIQLDQETSFQFGRTELTIIHTPGHTPGGICLYGQGHLFTGDTLFVKDSGRTDLPGGHRPTLGASLIKLMQLPDETIVWPGHDYGPMQKSTIGWEKGNNVNAKEYGYFSKK